MSPSDRVLLVRWSEHRDAEAFHELVNRYAGLVMATCLRVLGNSHDAEEVAQECFLRLASEPVSIRTSLAGWLHALATCRALDRLRADRQRGHRERTYAATRATGDDPTWDDVQRYVDEAIAALPTRLREPLVRHFMDRQTHETIAHDLGLSRASVTRRIARGVERVRASLRRKGIAIGAALLGTLLNEKLVEAAPVSAPLAAALGKLALSGGREAAATGAVMGMWLLYRLGALAVVAVVCFGGIWAALHGLRHDEGSAKAPALAAKPGAADQGKAPVVTKDGGAVRSTTVAREAKAAVPPVEPDTGHARLSGRVLLADTGDPVADAVVQAARLGNRRVVSRPANREGQYELNGLVSEDTYELTVRGYLLDSVVSVDFSDGTLSKEFDLRVRRGATVQGRILDRSDSKDTPWPGVTVFVAGHDETTSDSDGGYAIAGLPTGTIDVECVSPEGATDPRVPLSNGREGQKSSTNVEGGGTISGVDFAFSRVVYIAGHVTDAAGKPLAGVRITAHGLEATTTQDGSYQLAGLQDGSVGPVRAEAVGMSTVQKRVRLPVGQSVVDTDFVMGPSGSLSGRIVDEERRPVAAAHLSLTITDADGVAGEMPQAVQRPVLENEEAASTDADANGVFAMAVVPAGVYLTEVLGTPRGGTALARFAALSPPVQIAPGQSTTAEIVVQAPPEDTIEGTVRDIRGRPLAGAQVQAGEVDRLLQHPAETGEVSSRFASAPATTDANGFYRLERLSGWEFLLRCSKEGYAEAALAGVQSGARHADIVMAGTGSVSGVVVAAATGAPPAEARVYISAVKSDGDVQGTPGVRNRLASLDTQTGRFTLDNVPEGTLTLTADAPGFGLVRSGGIRVQAGATVDGIQLRLRPAASVKGRILLNGKPTSRVAWATAYPMDPTLAPIEKVVGGGSDAAFLFDNLAEGTYRFAGFVSYSDTAHRSPRYYEVAVEEGKTIHLDLEVGGSCQVRGTVVAPTDCTYLRVLAHDASQPLPTPESMFTRDGGGAAGYVPLIRGGGRYAILDLAPGTYVITAVGAQAGGPYKPAGLRYVSKTVTVGEGQSAGADLTIP